VSSHDGLSFTEALAASEQDDDEEDLGLSPYETIDCNLDSQERDLFLKSLSDEDGRGIFSRRWMWRLLQKGETLTLHERIAADVLADLVYWTSPKRGHVPNTNRGLQKRWTANSSRELSDRTGWPEHMVTKVLFLLKDRGFIGWHSRKFGGKKKRHMWMNWNVIRSAWKNN